MREGQARPFQHDQELRSRSEIFSQIPGSVTPWFKSGLGGATAKRAAVNIGAVRKTMAPTSAGDRLLKLMFDWGWVVTDLVKASGVSKTTIYRLLNVRDSRFSRSQLQTVLAVAKGFGPDVDGWWLFSGEGTPYGNHRGPHHES